MPIIAVINESNDVSDADLAVWVNAIQHQMLEDVAPFWKEAADANLLAVPRGQQPPRQSWQVVIAENTDKLNDLGYHQLTSFSLPLAKVFTQTTRGFGQTVSRVLSHEILEMVVDPFIARKQTIEGTTYLAEVGDPVHLDKMGYDKSGVLLSNFVTPDYYRYTSGNRFDFRDLLKQPCPALLSGGALCIVVGNTLQLQVAPDVTPAEFAAMGIHAGSRRHRWQQGHHAWRNNDLRAGSVSQPHQSSPTSSTATTL
jgi:hypothetical protein